LVWSLNVALATLLQIGHFAPVALGHSVALNSAFAAFKSWLKRQKKHCTQKGFTLGSLSHPEKGNQPEMALKAHDSRIAVGWLAHEASIAVDREGAGKLRLDVATSQVDLCILLELLPKYIRDPADVANLKAASERFWNALNTASAFAVETDAPRWNNLPKQHFQIHLMEDMANDGLNPLSYQGYTDEDFMQHVVRMGWGAAKGHLEPGILERWLLQQAETWAELAAAA
jgi:hypothetical protein